MAKDSATFDMPAEMWALAEKSVEQATDTVRPVVPVPLRAGRAVRGASAVTGHCHGRLGDGDGVTVGDDDGRVGEGGEQWCQLFEMLG